MSGGSAFATLHGLQRQQVPFPRTSYVSPRRPRVGELLCLIAVVAAGALMRVAPWLKPHVFLGVMEYDDGVYYAASRSLLHGLVPYRDFTIVHPPLTSILLLPAASIGAAFGDAVGMAAGRVEVAVAEMANVCLVYSLTRCASRGTDRLRRLAPLAAALLYAVAPGAVAAGHTILLEPFTNLLALAAMWLLLRRPVSRSAAAGSAALLAGAAGVKVFAAVYILAAVGWLFFTASSRLVAFAAGLGAGAVVVFVPVAALAGPGRMWRDLVTTQLSRPADGSVSVGDRVRSMTGLSAVSVTVSLLILAVCALVAAGVTAAARRRGLTMSPQLWLWLAVTALIGVAFARSPSYFDHYGGFFAAPFAVGIGIVLAASSVGALTWRAAATSAVLALVVPGTFWSVKGDATWRSDPSMAAVAAMVPPRACVYSDAVSLVIAADRFRPPSTGCPGWLDGRGQNLVWSGGRKLRHFYPGGFLVDRRWQQQTQRQLAAAAFLLVRSDPTLTPEWTLGIRTYVAEHFQLIWSSDSGRIPFQLWQRA